MSLLEYALVNKPGKMQQQQQFYLMSAIVSDFLTQSPKKVLAKADIYSKTLQNFHELPLGSSKSMVVQQLAEDRKNEIDFSIQQSEYQNGLFRRKEETDAATRSTFEKRIQSSREKNEANGRELEKKQAKQAELYEKHLKEVYRRYEEEERKKREHEKEESGKIKKELVEFYQREQERKKKAAHRQVQVATCYQSAVDRINSIHRRNEEYSLKAEGALKQELDKNNNFDRIISQKRRSLSSKNKRKEITYRQSVDNYNGREHRFIQKCGSNEDGALTAWKHIDAECGKTTKRIGQFFKRRYERWSTDKKRVDEARQHVPERCTGILNKTERASFRHTVSTFRDTAQEWLGTVERNKQAIREYDEMNKDKIMSTHLDMRLTNTSAAKINDRMRVMRLQAKKLADDFL